MNKENYRRRSIRLPTYDYSQGGWYFVTICTQNFRCDFGNIVNAEMELSSIGQMVDQEWQGLKNRFFSIDLGEYIIMPNHLHGIVVIKDDSNFVGAGLVPAHGQGDHKGRPYNKCPVFLGDIIGAFKSITTHECIYGIKTKNWPRFDKRFWQRNYYEHIIRNEESLDKIREYILKNPENWEYDRNNLINISSK